MRKEEFFVQLRKGLSGLPQEDIEECLSFYGEMIDDRMEDGLSEMEAISSIGSVDEIVEQTVAQTPLAKIAKERIKSKRRLSAVQITLLALGSPIWLSLVIAAIAVIFALYISWWAVLISLWSIFASFVACSGGGVVACVLFVSGGNGAWGLAMLAAGAVCAGLAIFMFYGCKAATKGTLILTKKMGIWMKNCFIKKEAAQ